jgi:cytochrome c biogenesis protein CcmG/thiol:disulfide interchange protein DsbE
MKIVFWRIIPLFIFFILVVFLWRGLSLDPQKLPSAKLGSPLPSFQLTVLGRANVKLTPDVFIGHVSLLNVWASWCAACIDEQVFLLKLAQDGVLIYGLNYKDTRDEATQWLAEWGNPYQLIGEDIDGKVGIDLGVYGAPETFLLDKKGIIRYRHVGVLNKRVWQEEFMPLIHQLEFSA